MSSSIQILVSENILTHVKIFYFRKKRTEKIVKTNFRRNGIWGFKLRAIL